MAEEPQQLQYSLSDTKKKSGILSEASLPFALRKYDMNYFKVFHFLLLEMNNYLLILSYYILHFVAGLRSSN